MSDANELNILERIARLEERIIASEKALGISREALNHWKEDSNKWREAMNDQRSQFVTLDKAIAISMITIAVMSLIMTVMFEFNKP